MEKEQDYDATFQDYLNRYEDFNVAAWAACKPETSEAADTLYRRLMVALADLAESFTYAPDPNPANAALHEVAREASGMSVETFSGLLQKSLDFASISAKVSVMRQDPAFDSFFTQRWAQVEPGENGHFRLPGRAPRQKKPLRPSRQRFLH